METNQTERSHEANGDRPRRDPPCGFSTIDTTRQPRPPAGCQGFPRRSLRRFLGQAVMGGLLFWRGRRLRGVLVAVVDPGLSPRFFSVLPTPANFRSR